MAVCKVPVGRRREGPGLLAMALSKPLGISTEWYFMVFDSIFLSIYVVEALLKIITMGLDYFYDPWNILGV